MRTQVQIPCTHIKAGCDCTPITPGMCGAMRRSLGLAGCQPSSKFGERPCLKGRERWSGAPTFSSDRQSSTHTVTDVYPSHIFKIRAQGVKSTCCSCRGPRSKFSSHHPCRLALTACHSSSARVHPPTDIHTIK